VSTRVLSLTLGLALLAPRPAAACGPDFPLEFLSDRAGTRAQLHDGLFLFEAKRLVPPPSVRFAVVEPPPWKAADTPAPLSDTPGGRAYARARAAYTRWREREGDVPAAFDETVAALRAVLALPEADRKDETLAAEYTLARLTGDEEGLRRVRARVQAGAPDPLGLAVASLGDEARAALDRGAIPHAITLYAEQAAHGSDAGAASLLFVARRLVADAERRAPHLDAPIVQRLLATYLWTRSEEVVESHAALSDELRARPSVDGADRLAAALYRAGRFEDAEALARGAPGPLAAWVRAKLAARRGDDAHCATELERAAEGFSLAERWSTPYSIEYRPRAQIEAERAILALHSGAYERALRHLLHGCVWRDAAYLAERVVDLDALQRLVDTSTGGASCGARRGPRAEDEGAGWENDDQAGALRHLLARRLVRAGRAADAVPYFPPALRADAARYAALEAEGADPQATFARARLLRTRGLELVGTEHGPDWAWNGGAFSLDGWGDDGETAAAATSTTTNPPNPLGTDAPSPDERARAERAAPRVTRRFHYRWWASALAEEAAGRVSPRSQSYGALLCHAARWVIDADPERATALYQRYVRDGALLPGMRFGRDCPEPTFQPPRAPPRRPLRKRTLAGLAAGGLLVGGVAAVFARRRRGMSTLGSPSGPAAPSGTAPPS
jgi:hypothetical protein